MKIIINEDETLEETVVTVSCRRLTPELAKMLSGFQMLEEQLVVTKGKETCFLKMDEVMYIESVDRKTFVYTGGDVYESAFRLCELEERLAEYGFFRAGRSCLIQLGYIRSLKSDINRRIRVTMENGEQLIVSRQYAEELKKRLGVR